MSSSAKDEFRSNGGHGDSKHILCYLREDEMPNGIGFPPTVKLLTFSFTRLQKKKKSLYVHLKRNMNINSSSSSFDDSPTILVC